MRSITDWIVRTKPDTSYIHKINGPVATAVFVAMLAAGITGGLSWMATSTAHHNAAAVVQIAAASQYE